VAIDSKIPGLMEGGFDPQKTALFVVHLDGVGVEAVLDSNPFGAGFKSLTISPAKLPRACPKAATRWPRKRLTSALEKLVRAYRTRAG
jgi:hypothetical protein